MIKYKCLSCNKIIQTSLMKNWKRNSRTYLKKFKNNDIITFILLLRKGIYPYEYIDGLERFNETTLPKK